MRRIYAPTAAVLALLATAGPAGAVTASLSGLVINACVLTVGSNGTLASSIDEPASVPKKAAAARHRRPLSQPVPHRR